MDASLFEPTGLETYKSATKLAAVYHRNAARIIDLMNELHSCVGEIREVFGDGDFSSHVSVCGADEADQIQRELKRTAWSTLIAKLGIERVMSSKRREELRDALCRERRSRREDDPIDELPDIDPQSIQDVLSGYAASADEFLDESIRAEYEWLKPWRGDEYKTNEQNRWKIGKKVIITSGVDRWYSGRFSASHYKQAHLQAIDTIFHLLDGKGIPLSHCGPLCDEISQVNTPGKPHETDYFRFKCYRNHTLHLEFKRPDLVAEFNFRCGNHHELPGYEKGGTYERASKTREDGPQVCAPGGDFNFYETPLHLAERMCDLADIHAGDRVLEPSAGSGSIAVPARNRGALVTCCEVHVTRFKGLLDLEFEAWRQNFLETTPDESFDAVLMNPPFTRCQDVMHIQHAWNFVRPGGRLVAIASSGVKYRSDKRTVAFREWLEEISADVRDLPEGTFKDSGTGVSTVLIIARKEDLKNVG